MPAPHTAYAHPAAHSNPPPLRLAHRLLSLVVRTNDTAVREFARMQFEPAIDSSNQIYEHYAFIRAASDRIDVAFDGERLFEALIPQSQDGKAVAGFYAVRDCVTHAISRANDCVIYGASVAVAGQGVLILGPPGCGKTLTAIHLAALGGELLGDEVACLTTCDMLDAVPRSLSIRADSFGSLPYASFRTPQYTPIGGATSAMYCVAAANCGVRQASSPVRLRFVLFIEDAAPAGVRALVPNAAEILFARYRQRKTTAPSSSSASLLRGVRAFRAGKEHPAKIAERFMRVVRCG